jgi:hypothetical protein
MIPVAFGFGVLVILVYWYLHTISAAYTALDLDEFRDSLSDLNAGVVAEAQMNRALSSQDWEFVREMLPPQVQELFQQERKTLVIRWLQRARLNVTKLVKQYKRLVRTNPNLSWKIEVQLAYEFYRFWLVCEGLILLVWLRGPLRTASTVRWTFHLARRFSSAFERLSTNLRSFGMHGIGLQ